LANTKFRWYTGQKLWHLFLMCAFPLHLWTIILAFRDISWNAERSNMWDAIGTVSYGVIFALAESLIIFLIVVLLGFLISKCWDAEKRITLLSVLVLVDALWSILSQYYFLARLSIPTGMIHFLSTSNHPIRIIYAFIVPPVILSALLPTYLILKSERALQFFLAVIDRLTLLMSFYLFFDFIGLVIVLIRNI